MARYRHGQSLDEPLIQERAGQTYFYHADHLGSIRLVTNAAGTVVNTYDYDSYGNRQNVVEAVENPYSYTGREYDGESGLYYYRARTYDPASGRFLQEDPLELGQGALWKILAPRIALPDANSPLRLATSDLNLYRYAGNNPLNAVDPAGTSSLRSYAITAATTASAAILATISRQEAVSKSLSSGLSGGLSRVKGFLSGVFGAIIRA